MSRIVSRSSFAVLVLAGVAGMDAIRSSFGITGIWWFCHSLPDQLT
jgi:hypothetical protein